MNEIKIMVVPGKIARVELTSCMTVLDACMAAERMIPGVGWVELARDREVRVQNRKFSNTDQVPEGYFGTIGGTPLNDGEVVLILTKIKGNVVGEAVLTCIVDGIEYALETPDAIANILANVAGHNLDEVKAIYINGEESPFDQLVGAGDEIEVEFYESEVEEEYFSEPSPEEFEAPAETVTVNINGHTVTGRPQDIKRILSC